MVDLNLEFYGAMHGDSWLLDLMRLLLGYDRNKTFDYLAIAKNE